MCHYCVIFSEGKGREACKKNQSGKSNDKERKEERKGGEMDESFPRSSS